MSDPSIPSRLPAGATKEGDGIVMGNGPVRVDAFIDFMCPFCRRFELSAGPALADLVSSGQISLIYHPMNFLDEASTSNYSTRATAASGCAADGRTVRRIRARAIRQPAPRGRTRAERCPAGRSRRSRRAGQRRLQRLRVRRALSRLAAVCDRARYRAGSRRDAHRPGRRRGGQA